MYWLVQNAGITRPGVAQVLTTSHDVVKTKYVYQVTACCFDMHEALACTRHFNKKTLRTQASSGTLFLGKNIW